MSIATSSDRSHAPYAEPDEYIDYQLRKTQTGIKRIDMLTAAIVAITVLIGYVLLFVLSDHWLFEGGVGGTARVLMFLPVIGFVGWLIGAKVVWPALRTVSGLYAARTLEASSAEFRSGLLNLVDLKQAGREVSPLILATMEKRAAVTLAKFNVDDAIDKRPLLTTLYVLFGIVVAFCLYSVLSPKKLGPSVLRAIVPFTNVTPATQTEILEVKPGDAKLRAGGILTVSVQLRGEVPADVMLLFTTGDRRFVDEPVQLGATTDPTLFEGTLGNDGHGLLQSFTYYVVAGDARSPEYRVEIITPPSATVTEVRYDYPEYTELDQSTQMGGAIDVWERTAITITAATNVSVKRAKLEFDDTEDFASSYDGPSPKIEESGKRLRVEWRVNPRERDGKFPKFYRIKVWDAEDTPDPKPAVYPINVRIDQPPQVVLIDPTMNLELPANGTVPLVVAARDQDFKLRTVSLKIARDENDVTDETLFDGSQSEVSLKHDFQLEPLRLREGDKIRIWVEAQDNRLPTHNLAKTPPIEITIKNKVSKEEAKKQLEQEKKEQQQRIDEANKNKEDQEAPQKNDQNEKQQEQNERKQTAIEVRLFDDKSNQPLDVKDYLSQSGLEALLFRGEVLGDYDYTEKKWTQGTHLSRDEAVQPLPQGPGNQSTIRQEIRKRTTRPSNLFAMPRHVAVKFEAVNPPQVQGRVTSVLYSDEPALEINYVVYSVKATPADRLPFPVATQSNGVDRDEYLRLEPRCERLRAFAKKLASETDGTPVAIARRMRDELRTKGGFKYLEPEQATATNVEDFLFQRKAGHCEYFARALTLLLRSVDIPARCVGGLAYKPDDDDTNPAKIVIQQKHLHSWVEVHLDGRWRVLDGTPGGPGGPSDQANQQQQNANDPNEREQPQDNQPKDDRQQQDDKNSKGKNEGEEKDQKNGQGDKKQSNNGGKSGKQSLKNDGTQDQEALEKIAQNEKRHGRLPKKNDQQSSSSQKPNPNGDSQPGDAKPGDSKPGDSKPGDSKPGDSKPGDSKPGDLKPGDSKPGDSKPGDSKPGDSKPGDSKPGDSKPGDSKPGDSKPGDSKPGDSKPGDSKPGDSKPGDSKPGDSKPGDSKPGDSKPGDSKPGDSKPGDSKPGDSKPGDSKPGDSKPGDSKPGDSKPGDSKPGDSKPGDSKPGSPKSKPGSTPGSGSPGQPGDPSAPKSSSGSGSNSETPAEANEEFTKEAANLVLKRLQKDIERGEVDQELLDELGWNEEQMKKFVERMQKELEAKADDDSPQAKARQRQFEEMLKNLNLTEKTQRRDDTTKDKQTGDGIGPVRRPPPAEIRESFERYTKSMSKKKVAETPKK